MMKSNNLKGHINWILDLGPSKYARSHAHTNTHTSTCKNTIYIYIYIYGLRLVWFVLRFCQAQAFPVVKPATLTTDPKKSLIKLMVGAI